MIGPLIRVGASKGFEILKKIDWTRIILISALFGSASFSASHFFKEVGQAILGLWPLLALVGLILVAREFVKAWAKVKKAEYEARGEEK